MIILNMQLHFTYQAVLKCFILFAIQVVCTKKVKFVYQIDLFNRLEIAIFTNT